MFFFCFVFFCFLIKFALLFPCHEGSTANKGTKFNWCVFQPGGSQLCKECWMCIKCLYSLLNSHTTVVMYNSYVQCRRHVQLLDRVVDYPPAPRPVSPLLVSRLLAQIATKQEHKLSLWFICVVNVCGCLDMSCNFFPSHKLCLKKGVTRANNLPIVS